MAKRMTTPAHESTVSAAVPNRVMDNRYQRDNGKGPTKYQPTTEVGPKNLLPDQNKKLGV